MLNVKILEKLEVGLQVKVLKWQAFWELQFVWMV